MGKRTAINNRNKKSMTRAHLVQVFGYRGHFDQPSKNRKIYRKMGKTNNLFSVAAKQREQAILQGFISSLDDRSIEEIINDGDEHLLHGTGFGFDPLDEDVPIELA